MMSHFLSCCATTPCASARELVSLGRAFRVEGERESCESAAGTNASSATDIQFAAEPLQVQSAVPSLLVDCSSDARSASETVWKANCVVMNSTGVLPNVGSICG